MSVDQQERSPDTTTRSSSLSGARTSNETARPSESCDSAAHFPLPTGGALPRSPAGGAALGTAGSRRSPKAGALGFLSPSVSPLGAVVTDFPRDQVPVFKGVLSKMGKSQLFKRWHRRYFVLYPGFLLYWPEEKDFALKRKPKGSVDLAECSLATAEQHTKRANTFGIFHHGRRDYFLEAPSHAVLLEWVRHIEHMLGVDESTGIEDFNLLNLVGKGAYGKVVQVRKKDTGKVYAMKMISKESLKRKHDLGRGDMEKFKNELDSRPNLRGIVNVEKAAYKHWMVQSTKAERRVLEVVNHPFIVKLHFAFQTHDKLCLVLDFVNGGELFSYIAKEKMFSEERARFYTAELILALEYLHEMCIIYRDLKPENVLLDHEGHIRLTDFGHSKDDHSRDDRAFSMVGSPYYMAPEILLNSGHGNEVDWWSLGILVYEMIVGLPPFYQQNTRKAYEMLLTQPISFPDTVSPAAQQMVRALLNVDASKRLGRGEVDRSLGDDMQALALKWNVPWLQSVRWRRLLSKLEEPPFKPRVSGPEDISKFAQHFTNEMVSHMAGRAPVSDLGTNAQSEAAERCDVFSDFSYVAPISKKLTSLNSTVSHYQSAQLSPFDSQSPSTLSPKTASSNALLPPPLCLSAQEVNDDAQLEPVPTGTLKRRLSAGEAGSLTTYATDPINRTRSAGDGDRNCRTVTSRTCADDSDMASSARAILSSSSSRDSGPGEALEYTLAPTGRHLLAKLPVSVGDRLNRLDARNKALKTLVNKHDAADALLGPAAVGASNLLAHCRWDMHEAVDAMLDALHKRDEIDECFTRKGDMPISRQAQRVEVMQVALNKVLAELNKQTRREPNDEDPLTLPTFAATSAPASQVSAGDGVKRVHSGSDLASASEASHDDPRSRQSSVLSLADEKLHQFDSEAAHVLRRAAAHRAALDQERDHLRYGDQGTARLSEMSLSKPLFNSDSQHQTLSRDSSFNAQDKQDNLDVIQQSKAATMQHEAGSSSKRAVNEDSSSFYLGH